MKNLKKLVWIIILLVVAFLYAHVDKNYYLYDRQQDSEEYVATGILQDEDLAQKFVAECDNLDGIKVKTTVYGDVNKVKIEYRLLDAESNKVVAEGSVGGSDIKNGKFYDWQFDRVTGTKGKEFIFQISEDGSDEMNGIGFDLGNSNNKNSKELIVKGNSTAGTLVCRIVEHKFDVETFIMFLAFIAYIVIFMKALYKLFK